MGQSHAVNAVTERRSQADGTLLWFIGHRQLGETLTISDLLQVLRKHLTTLIVTFVVVIAVVAAYIVLTPPKYTATAQLFATYSGSADSNTTPDSSEISSGTSYLSTQIKTYPQLVKTQAVLQPVIDDLGLDTTVNQLADMVTATNPANTFMVDISVEAGDAADSSKIANSVADSLAQQISSALYAENKGKSLIQLSLVQKAQTPTSPSSPKVALYSAVGVVLALIVAVMVALLKDVLNTKIDGVDDVRSITEASPLGVLAKVDALNERRPVVVSQPSSPEAEEFRRIRTNISFLNPELNGKGHLLVISSVEPAEGKTTNSVNIASAIAEDGKTVLLIDADLRHPSVARKLGLEGHVGLSHILSGQATPKDVVQPYWKPNLQVLPAGKRPGNASILLNSTVMKELIEQAQTQYDYVILDTTPLSVANDATMFGKMANGLVLVVGRGVSDKKELDETIRSLSEVHVPILGFILNYAKHNKAHTNAYYYYYQDGSKKQDNRRH